MPRFFTALCLVFSLLCAAAPALAQEEDKGKKDDKPKVKPLPDDERLLQLHKDFEKKAEKLANEYENTKNWGKARAVYEEILKLVPQYPTASAKLTEMIQREAGAQKPLIT